MFLYVATSEKAGDVFFLVANPTKSNISLFGVCFLQHYGGMVTVIVVKRLVYIGDVSRYWTKSGQERLKRTAGFFSYRRFFS